MILKWLKFVRQLENWQSTCLYRRFPILLGLLNIEIVHSFDLPKLINCIADANDAVRQYESHQYQWILINTVETSEYKALKDSIVSIAQFTSRTTDDRFKFEAFVDSLFVSGSSCNGNNYFQYRTSLNIHVSRKHVQLLKGYLVLCWD